MAAVALLMMSCLAARDAAGPKAIRNALPTAHGASEGSSIESISPAIEQAAAEWQSRVALESQVQEKEVTEGSFRGLSVGHSKDQSLADLRAMGVEFIRPDLRDEIRVTRSANLDELSSAEGLIVGAGDVVVSFEGDDVVHMMIAPIFPRWKAMLSRAQGRVQVFGALGKILDENPNVVVRSHAPDSEYVHAKELSSTGQKLLRKYDLWEVSYDDDEGQWSLRLQFDDDHLQKIGAWHSPGEVP